MGQYNHVLFGVQTSAHLGEWVSTITYCSDFRLNFHSPGPLVSHIYNMIRTEKAHDAVTTLNQQKCTLIQRCINAVHHGKNGCYSFKMMDIFLRLIVVFKHTTTLFSLSDHYILSREWRVIVDQVQTNYHGRPMVL